MKYYTKTETLKVIIEGKEVELVSYEPANLTERLYYLCPPPEPTYEGQIKHLIIKIFFQLDGEKKGRLPYHFSIHEFLKVQNVTQIIKEDMLKHLRETLSCFPEEKVNLYLENIQKRIETFTPPQPIVKQKPELKINQIALKYAYEGLQITRENGNEIAKEYGHNSGEKLFQRFTHFSSLANRKGKPDLCTPKKLDNKIKLIESVIELLPTDKQERAKNEVLTLKKIYESEYQ